jgi:hypothetical protein
VSIVLAAVAVSHGGHHWYSNLGATGTAALVSAAAALVSAVAAALAVREARAAARSAAQPWLVCQPLRVAGSFPAVSVRNVANAAGTAMRVLLVGRDVQVVATVADGHIPPGKGVLITAESGSCGAAHGHGVAVCFDRRLVLHAWSFDGRHMAFARRSWRRRWRSGYPDLDEAFGRFYPNQRASLTLPEVGCTLTPLDS